MAIVIFQHEPHETCARLGEVFASFGHRLRTIRLFAGEAIPPDLDDVDGVFSMGGNMNVDQTDQHAWIRPEMEYLKLAHDAKLPVIGVCLGAQLLAVALGGEVGPMEKAEVGWHKVTQTFFGTVDPIFAGIPWDSVQFHVHGQEVKKAPPGGTPIPLVGSAACKCQAFKAGDRTYGFQYHFEWDRDDLEVMLKQPFVQANADVNAIRAQIDDHYENYRRLGDRLAERMAMCLAPIDKRHGALA